MSDLSEFERMLIEATKNLRREFVRVSARCEKLEGEHERFRQACRSVIHGLTQSVEAEDGTLEFRPLDDMMSPVEVCRTLAEALGDEYGIERAAP